MAEIEEIEKDQEDGQETDEKLDVIFSFMSEIGISKEMVEAFKPMIPKFFIDLIRGVPKFADEDRRIRTALEKSMIDKNDRLAQNIYSVRNFMLTLTGFSLTVIGVSLANLIKPQNSFWHSTMLYSGIIALGINVIGSVIYLLYIHTIENQKIAYALDKDKEITEKLSDLLLRTFQDPTKTFDNYMAERKTIFDSAKEKDLAFAKRKKDWNPHILSGFFLGGLIIIAFSFFIH